ncbi:hypothetical protein VM57_17225 [Stenotrophomonas maltophilia]|uniref:Uncharacterized protein n=1 Tax=Stenotrophomonas maltophilia TaxID=40324 RepID=A0A0F5ZME6_STEMA|nr:hypothetical protein VM57_17225 [Stenotrophomonas maltophilia]
MRVLIDCGAKDLFSTANGQGTHLGTQGVFDAVEFLFDLGLSLSLHTVSFDASLFTGFLDKLSSAFLACSMISAACALLHAVADPLSLGPAPGRELRGWQRPSRRQSSSGALAEQ